MTSETSKVEKSQLDKFKEAAREHGADESDEHWDERLKRLVKAKAKPEKPPATNPT